MENIFCQEFIGSSRYKSIILTFLKFLTLFIYLKDKVGLNAKIYIYIYIYLFTKQDLVEKLDSKNIGPFKIWFTLSQILEPRPLVIAIEEKYEVNLCRKHSRFKCKQMTEKSTSVTS